MIIKTTYYIRSVIHKHVLFQSTRFSKTHNDKIKLKLESNIVNQVWDHIEDQVWEETL